MPDHLASLFLNQLTAKSGALHIMARFMVAMFFLHSGWSGHELDGVPLPLPLPLPLLGLAVGVLVVEPAPGPAPEPDHEPVL